MLQELVIVIEEAITLRAIEPILELQEDQQQLTERHRETQQQERLHLQQEEVQVQFTDSRLDLITQEALIEIRLHEVQGILLVEVLVHDLVVLCLDLLEEAEVLVADAHLVVAEEDANS